MYTNSIGKQVSLCLRIVYEIRRKTQKKNLDRIRNLNSSVSLAL